MAIYSRGVEATEMPNQVYAGSVGQIVTLKYEGRRSAKRKGGDVDAVDFHFSVVIDDNPQHVGVAISSDAARGISNWLADPKNYGQADEADVIELGINLSIARILEAVDQKIHFAEDK